MRSAVIVALLLILIPLALPLAAADVGTCIGESSGSGTPDDPYKCTGYHTGGIKIATCLGNYDEVTYPDGGTSETCRGF